MVVANEPDPAFCAGKEVVPNILHRVWVGRPCPHVYDLVSMLSTVLLLKPERILYHRTFDWMPCTARKTEMPLKSCYQALGVEYVELNMTGSDTMIKDSSTFEQDTRDFGTRNSFTGMSHINRMSIAGPPHLSDLIRLHALHKLGGYYFDADSFLLSGNVSRFRRCPFVMSVDGFDRPTGRPPANATSEEVLSGVNLPGLPANLGFNNGAMIAAPGSAFGEAWWKYMRHWGGSGWAVASCVWPKQWEKRNQRALQGTPVMRNFPFRKWHRNLTWAQHVEHVATLGAEAVHLSNAKVRTNMLIIASVILERAVRLVGGDQALTPAQAQCVNLARDWLTKSPGEHGDIIRLGSDQ